jgi:hypothetical protein
MHPRLAPQLRRESHVLPQRRAQRPLIRRRTRPARRPPLRNLRQLHQRFQLQPPLYVPASHLLPRDRACRCGRRQHREARPREHVLRQQRPAPHVLLAHLRLCNAIRVPVRLLQVPCKRVQARRKPCARAAERRNNIVLAARRRVVPVVRPGSVQEGRLRGSHNVPEAEADQVAATIKDRSARSAPAQGFPRRSQASRSMRASPRHADGR